MRQNVRSDPRPVVPNLHQHSIEIARGPHPQLALPLHGLDGVGHQVRPNLIELAAKSADSREVFAVLADDIDSAFEAVVENRQRALQPLMQINLLHGGLVHVRIFFDRSDQVRNAFGAVLNLAYQF